MIEKLSGMLGGRRAENGKPPRGVHAVAVACSRPGCEAAEGYQCQYTDGQGQQCGWWCRAHIKFVHGSAWCERHANTVRELSARRNTIYEIKTMATLEDRSPSLCSLIVEDVDPHVRAALERIYQGHDTAEVVTDPTVRDVKAPRQKIYEGPDGITVERQGHDRAWERGWGVVSHQGYLARVMVRVTTTEPPTVAILVNGHTVLKGVPDWIAVRAGGGTPTEAEREAYRARVVEAILAELHSPR